MKLDLRVVSAPDNNEIRRRLADHIEFSIRFINAIKKEPGDYYLGEDWEELERVFEEKEFLKMIFRLLPDSDQVLDYYRKLAVDEPTLVPFNDDDLKKEGLLEKAGESKTNMLSRLRDKLMDFVFGGAKKSDILSSLGEYVDYAKVVTESLEAVSEPYGKVLSEFYGFTKTLFSRAAHRASISGD